MKKQEIKQIREKDTAELAKRVADIKAEIAKISPRISAGYESNLKQVKNKRRDIAQILGIIREKQNQK